MYLLYKCNNPFIMNSVEFNSSAVYSLVLSKALTSSSFNFRVFFHFDSGF